ncbi:MAG TPA: hypothetical protein VHX86_19745 [Tepidisphaeraceae bacterium]|jgi:hypothetical protein|nr:hypothetical protein [Tepidisphaeraceae bacterium]
MLAEKLYNQLTLSENTPREHDKSIRSRGERKAVLASRVAIGGSHTEVLVKDYLIWFTNDECYFSRVTESGDDRDVLVLRKINPDRRRLDGAHSLTQAIGRAAYQSRLEGSMVPAGDGGRKLVWFPNTLRGA